MWFWLERDIWKPFSTQVAIVLVTLLCVVVGAKDAQIDLRWSETIQSALNSASANKID